MKANLLKKGVAFIAILALTAGLSLTAFATEPQDSAPQGDSNGAVWQNPFGDVRESDWYYHNDTK